MLYRPKHLVPSIANPNGEERYLEFNSNDMVPGYKIEENDPILDLEEKDLVEIKNENDHQLGYIFKGDLEENDELSQTLDKKAIRVTNVNGDDIEVKTDINYVSIPSLNEEDFMSSLERYSNDNYLLKDDKYYHMDDNVRIVTKNNDLYQWTVNGSLLTLPSPRTIPSINYSSSNENFVIIQGTDSISVGTVIRVHTGYTTSKNIKITKISSLSVDTKYLLDFNKGVAYSIREYSSLVFVFNPKFSYLSSYPWEFEVVTDIMPTEEISNGIYVDKDFSIQSAYVQDFTVAYRSTDRNTVIGWRLSDHSPSVSKMCFPYRLSGNSGIIIQIDESPDWYSKSYYNIIDYTNISFTTVKSFIYNEEIKYLYNAEAETEEIFKILYPLYWRQPNVAYYALQSGDKVYYLAYGQQHQGFVFKKNYGYWGERPVYNKNGGVYEEGLSLDDYIPLTITFDGSVQGFGKYNFSFICEGNELISSYRYTFTLKRDPSITKYKTIILESPISPIDKDNNYHIFSDEIDLGTLFNTTIAVGDKIDWQVDIITDPSKRGCGKQAYDTNLEESTYIFVGGMNAYSNTNEIANGVAFEKNKISGAWDTLVYKNNRSVDALYNGELQSTITEVLSSDQVYLVSTEREISIYFGDTSDHDCVFIYEDASSKKGYLYYSSVYGYTEYKFIVENLQLKKSNGSQTTTILSSLSWGTREEDGWLIPLSSSLQSSLASTEIKPMFVAEWKQKDDDDNYVNWKEEQSLNSYSLDWKTIINNIGNLMRHKYQILSANNNSVLFDSDWIYSSDMDYSFSNFAAGQSYRIKVIVTDELDRTFESISPLLKVDYSPILDSNMLTLSRKDLDSSIALDKTEVVTGDETHSYIIKRKAKNDLLLTHIGEMTAAQGLIDYTVCANKEYEYYIIDKGENTTTIYKTTPFKVEWNGWTLMETIPTEEKGVYRLDRIYRFNLNLTSGSMTNNSKNTIIENFTQYPKIQYGRQNYWSGTLQSLLGVMDIEEGTQYHQNTEQLNVIKYLTTNARRKFLKDRDGNIFEVGINGAITIENTDNLTIQLKSKSVPWVEIGDASKVSIILDGDTANQWLLTDGVIPSELVRYKWLDTKAWEDEKYFTEGVRYE